MVYFGLPLALLNNGVLIQWQSSLILQAGTTTKALPIAYTRFFCLFINRTTFYYSTSMTNELAGKPNLTTIQLNTGSNQNENTNWISIGV